MTIIRPQTFAVDGSGAAGSGVVTFADTPYQIKAGQTVLVDSSGGDIRLDTPPSPVQNMWFRVKRVTSDPNFVDIFTDGTDQIGSPFPIFVPATQTVLLGSGAIAEWQYDANANPPRWHVTSASKIPDYSEIWAATAIAVVGATPDTILWTFQPLWTGHTPQIATHSLGTFTYQLDGTFSLDLSIEYAFVSTGTNTDANFRLSDNFSGGGNHLLLDILGGMQSSKSATLPWSANTKGTAAPNVGDTVSYTILETASTGAMTISFDGGLLVISV